MNRYLIVLVLVVNYFVFGLLLNSVGVVILQSINSFDVSKESAAALEGFKDIPIAIMSFFVASLLPQLGYRRAILIGSGVVTVACATVPLLQTFWATKFLFLCVGASFALIKLSVYSCIGLLAGNSRTHTSLANLVEGIFMLGVLSGYWIFSLFIDANEPDGLSWLNTYWLLAALCGFSFLLTLAVNFHHSAQGLQCGSSRRPSNAHEFLSMLRLLAKPLIYVFVISLFFYVLIEQGIGSWLPTFNNQVLKLPTTLSVQATSIFALSLAVGRLSAGIVASRVHWYYLLTGCVVAMATLVIIVIPLADNVVVQGDASWLNLPFAAYALPLIGLLMAPIYPSLSSAVLSSLPAQKHSSMTGLIVIFSALGGTVGSLVTGAVFSHFSGQVAMYVLLLPMAIMLVLLYQLKRETGKLLP